MNVYSKWYLYTQVNVLNAPRLPPASVSLYSTHKPALGWLESSHRREHIFIFNTNANDESTARLKLN